MQPIGPEKFMTPQQLSRAVDVSESTLKRWIDRGLIRAYRTAGGHRRLAVTDVINFLRQSGVAVKFPQAIGLPGLDPDPATIGSEPEHPSAERLCDLLAQGDVHAVQAAIFNLYLKGQRLHTLFDTIVAPAMRCVGERWQHGQLSIFAEHRSTQIMFSVIMRLRAMMLEPRPDAPLAVGAAPEGDPYALPTLLCELTLRDLGWQTVNLGPYLPLTSLEEAIHTYKPKLAWLSITTQPIHASPQHFAQLHQTAKDANCTLVVGGQALAAAPPGLVRADYLGSSLTDFAVIASSAAPHTHPQPATISSEELQAS